MIGWWYALKKLLRMEQLDVQSHLLVHFWRIFENRTHMGGRRNSLTTAARDSSQSRKLVHLKGRLMMTRWGFNSSQRCTLAPSASISRNARQTSGSATVPQLCMVGT